MVVPVPSRSALPMLYHIWLFQDMKYDSRGQRTRWRDFGSGTISSLMIVQYLLFVDVTLPAC